MDFRSYLKISAEEINLELEKFLKGWSREVEKISPKLIFLNQEFVKACEGGKRLRGALVKLGYEIARSSVVSRQSSDKLKEILKPAAAFEIFQTAILAHDDIIDLSPIRRGKSTIFKALGGNHYGISQTICLGDIGFFLSQKLISESNFEEKLKNKALASFADTFVKTGLGEMLDVEIPHLKKGVSEEDILTIFKLKTAKYTISGPMQLGAILGGGDEKLLKNLEKFGEKLGIAFQIQDDILGIFGDEETLGKSVTSDIEEGKVTLLYLYALENGGKEELEGIYGSKVGLSHFAKASRDKEGLEKVRKIFKETGALGYSNKKAEGLVADAKKVIPFLTTNSPSTSLRASQHRAILSEMADFLVSRSF
ncbi:MAG: polyprenyl synthetase family protein [Candidatus Daviesbacteria bacterium]|nr:polyprenyl synthetase family protein [Candidatus Daviesbacteria bacterium]